MTTYQDRSNHSALLMARSGFVGALSENYETRISRIERLGIHLFRVANCLVSFGNLSARFDRGENSVIALEALFCDSQSFPDEIRVICDTRLDSEFVSHRMVAGDPHIRFYATHPIVDSARNIVGSLNLIDYQPHEFDDEHRLLLADLAVMVERELILSAMQQTQLELIKQNRNLKRESLIDPILGTWNKPAIIRSLRIEMERCGKAGKPISLLFASLDQIAAIRDFHGIATSDMVLVNIVSRIRSCIRPFDALGRFGSDIFLMVLPGASHLVATAVAERIRLSIMSHPDTIDEKSIDLTISAGIISTDIFPDAEPEALIAYAEKALLSARNAGNNRVVQAMPEQPDITI
ncbi:MAG: diguanylate cyclase [Undibacterium sp.]|nr:diguanylate cyclase [Undibacterium sp.]